MHTSDARKRRGYDSHTPMSTYIDNAIGVMSYLFIAAIMVYTLGAWL